MLISSYIFSDLEFCSVNFSSVYENSELKVFKNIKYLGEMSSNWPSNLLGTNVYETLECCW